MITTPDATLASLLDKLRNGDTDAATDLFLAYEPFLRLVVRRQLSVALRAKFDSADVVQSVWADLVEGFRRQEWNFPDIHRLRAFLVRTTRNRFIDRVRQHLGDLEREQRLANHREEDLPPSPLPQPIDIAQATELWEMLQEICPASHQEILRMKRLGFALAEIAERTNMHPSSVRRVLYDLAKRAATFRGESATCTERIAP